MALTPETLAKLSVDFFGAEMEDALTKWKSYFSRRPINFASKVAEAEYKQYLAEGLTMSPIVATGRNGKVGVDDVRAAFGVQTKRKAPREWSSPAAQTEMLRHGLTPEDFPEDARTGTPIQTPLASGCTHRITIKDVRQLLIARGQADDSIAETFFTSPGVFRRAKENGLSPSDFGQRDGTISKAEVDVMIEARKPKKAVKTFEEAVEDEVEDSEFEED